MTSNEKVMKYLKQKYPLEKNTPENQYHNIPRWSTHKSHNR